MLVKEITMDKTLMSPGAQAKAQATLPAFGVLAEGRSTRGRAPVDRERARQACAPMGSLVSVVVTVDSKQRQRTWYVVEPDVALAANYAAHGLDVTTGSKVLVDAEAMRPVALIDLDPSEASKDTEAHLGFNPYWDLPPT